jgi:hypothetical protein
MTGNSTEQPSKAKSTYNHNYNLFVFAVTPSPLSLGQDITPSHDKLYFLL